MNVTCSQDHPPIFVRWSERRGRGRHGTGSANYPAAAAKGGVPPTGRRRGWSLQGAYLGTRERSADNPSMSLVTRLADHFGVSVASLVGEDLLAGDAVPTIARMFRQAGELEPEDLAFLDEMMQALLRRRRKSGAGV